MPAKPSDAQAVTVSIKLHAWKMSDKSQVSKSFAKLTRSKSTLCSLTLCALQFKLSAIMLFLHCGATQQACESTSHSPAYIWSRMTGFRIIQAYMYLQEQRMKLRKRDRCLNTNLTILPRFNCSEENKLQYWKIYVRIHILEQVLDLILIPVLELQASNQKGTKIIIY